MKRYIYILILLVLPIMGYAQEGVLALPKGKHLDTNKLKDLRVYPLLNKPVHENFSTKINLTGIEDPLKKIEADPTIIKLPPLKAYIGPSLSPSSNFKNPYINDYSSHAIWGINNKSFITTSSIRESMPAIGRNQYVSASYNVAPTDWLSVSVGTFVGKMQFNSMNGLKRNYNDLGFKASARFKVNDRIYFNTFGSYSKQAKLNLMGVPALGSFATRSYGGTMDVMITETIGVKVGVERYFDANSGKWRVSPIISPILHFK